MIQVVNNSLSTQNFYNTVALLQNELNLGHQSDLLSVAFANTYNFQQHN